MAHEKKGPIPDVGALVGRFQVPELHDGHREVLNFVSERHDHMIVVLGNNATGIATAENPLDYKSREQMIEAEYPEATIFYIEDEWSDIHWSKKLDGLIQGALGSPLQSVQLYGGRDSFISHYHGKWPTQELEADAKVSATQIRAEVRKRRPDDDVAFRRGSVYTANRRFPTTYTTVDIAVFNDGLTEILLGRKPREDKWRLCGGFAEPHSPDFESDAAREALEELNITVTQPIYVASQFIDDWRYKGERDKIKTILFAAKRKDGEVVAGDDIEAAEWFKIDKEFGDYTLNGQRVVSAVMENHVSLVNKAIRWAKGENR